jgi:hypothetical protein
MSKIRIYDKDLNEKWLLLSEQLDWGIDFSVTENGFGDLDFSVVGDVDIDGGDIVKVIDRDYTVEEVITNNNYLLFDGTNDYVQRGTSIARRGRVFTDTWLTLSSDWYGDYLTNFWWASPTYRYVDIWGVFDEIDQANSFSIKFSVELTGGTIFQHNDFIIKVESSEVRIWRIWWVGVSFAYSAGTYYRLVIVWNWSAFTAYRNSTLITGTNAPSGTLMPYCMVWCSAFGNDFTNAATKRYWMCIRNRVLTAWETTAENASASAVTATDRIYNVNGSWLLTVDNIITSGIASGDITATTHIVISTWFKLWGDWSAVIGSQPILETPYVRAYVYESDNKIQLRYDNAGAKVSFYSLGNGDRDWHHMVGVVYHNWTSRKRELYIDNALVHSGTHASPPSTKYTDYITIGKYSSWSTYFNGAIWPSSFYTFTWSFDARDAERLYYGLPPEYTSNITEYTAYTMTEGSGALLGDATIYNWATWQTTNDAPFVKTESRVVEIETYYW